MAQRNQEKDCDGKRSVLNRDIKKGMVKALIWSVTLYGAETWTMRKEDVKRVEAFEGDRTKWYWTKWYGQNGTDKMVSISIDSNPTELNFYSVTTSHK